jgi:hypothetical protein
MNYTPHQFNQTSLDPRKPHSLASAVGAAIGTLNAIRDHLDKDGYPATAASCRLAADELLAAWKAHVKAEA